jgi:YfiH family protein
VFQKDCFRWEDPEATGESVGGYPTFNSDGVVSNVPSLVVAVTSADCVPLLLWDPVRQVVGLAHAGWRGSALGVGERVVATMTSVFGCRQRDIVAAIGPSIGPCCYHVGAEVVETFHAHGTPVVASPHNGRSALDLWETNAVQLIRSGLEPDAIENPRICTACRTEHFYSHRREMGRTGRFAAFIGL